jgi:hypothetical protein
VYHALHEAVQDDNFSNPPSVERANENTENPGLPFSNLRPCEFGQDGVPDLQHHDEDCTGSILGVEFTDDRGHEIY